MPDISNADLTIVSWMNKMLGTMIRSAGGKADEPMTPLLQSKKGAGNSRRLLVGNRKFKVGELAIGDDGQKVQVVAEKRYVHYGPVNRTKKGQSQTAIYHPLKSDMQTLDTSIELSMQKNGEWTTRRHEAPGNHEAWLKDGAFETLDITNEALSRPGRYLKMGSRDFCFADVEGQHKDATKTDRLLIERLPSRTADNAKFRLLNADLSPGAEVQLVPSPGQVAVDPFTAHAMSRAQEGFHRRPDKQMARTAAMAAMGVGVDVDTAIDIANDMTLSIPLVNRQDLQGCGIAAAVSATARCAGIDREVARRAGQAILGFRPDGGQAVAQNPARQNAQRIQATATVASQCLTAAQTEHRHLDRSLMGPGINAVDELARFLFQETKPGSAVSEAAAIAKAKDGAQRMVARAAEDVEQYHKEAEAAVASEATIREWRDRTRTELEAVRNQIGSVSQELYAAADHGSEVELQRLGSRKRDLDNQHRELEAVLVRRQRILDNAIATAERAVRQADEAGAAARDMKWAHDSKSLTTEIEVVARAMLAARSAAPDSPEAGRAAALAALYATRSAADEATAAYSAKTAALTVLAGAGPGEAEVAGMAALRYRQARGSHGASELDDTAAQILIAGSAQPTPVAGADQLALAAAATVILTHDPAQQRAAAAILSAKPPSAHQDYSVVPQEGTKFFIREHDTLAAADEAAKVLLSKDKQPLIPPGYEPLSVLASARDGTVPSGYEHARMRTVSNVRVTSTSRQEYQRQYIEVATASGSRVWAEYIPDSTANEMTGRIAVKPSGLPDTALGGQSYIQVAFNGYRKEWRPLSSRTEDFNAILEWIYQEIDKLAVARDSDWSFWTTPYRFDDSPEAQSIVDYMKGSLKPLVTNYMRGRISGTTYERDVNDLKLRILNRLQQHRNWKKHLTRSGIRIGISIVGGIFALALGIARVALAA
jgi:hypothetical protein